MSFNLATILRESTLAGPGKPMLLFGGTTLSYGEVDAVCGRVATALRRAGLEPGDTIALQLPNVPQFVFGYFGAILPAFTNMFSVISKDR